VNTFDGQEYRFLFDAQAALNSVKADVAAGKITLNPTEKDALNKAIQSYNLAEAQWHAYHSGATSDTAGLSAAINQLVSDVNAIVAVVQAGGKKP
jgi:cbb3-type cytochrome oxidase cytochrome c subunit